MTETLGRYEIFEEIGRGGFAIVYRGRDNQLGRDVALKELRPLLLRDDDWVRRFRREARTIARLDHPHIVPIYDIYEADSRLFLVMRLVNGPGLEDLISRRVDLPWDEIVEIISAVADGLDYAHQQGILHRDLKPANILIDVDRGPMLTDFGLARLAGEHSAALSASGTVVGTPHYIAPEVWEGKGSSPQADVYSLACVLYEMIAGDKLFKGETSPTVMLAHFKPLSLPSAWPAGVPAGVTAVLDKALAANPAERYPTAGHLAAALQQLALTDAPAAAKEELPRHPTPPAPAVSELHQAKQRLGDSREAAPVGAAAQPAARPTGSAGQAAFAFNPLAKDTDSANDEPANWPDFFKHLAIYAIVISGLGFLNSMTGDYPWFLWPALGWGIGVAFDFWETLSKSLIQFEGKWREFLEHVVAYAIVNSALAGMNQLTGDYPWFLWPAGIWGIGLVIHLVDTLFKSEDKSARAKRASRRERRRAKWQARWQTRQQVAAAAPEVSRAEDGGANAAIQAHLEKARAYRQQITDLINNSPDRHFQPHLEELGQQVDDWTRAIEALARRVDTFERNDLIQHDLETVPQAIQKLEAQLETETDASTRAELARALENRRTQLDTLQKLQNTMRRAEIKIENTLSLLGTIYPQILTRQSTDQVADYSRLTQRVSEEVRTLEDHLAALEEVKLGRAG